MNYVIDAQGLTKRYRRTVAVDNIDLQIPAGRIVGLIGPNGGTEGHPRTGYLRRELERIGQKPLQ